MPKDYRAQKSFWTHPMVLLGDEAQVEARFGLCFEIVPILIQDRSTTFVECSIGSEIILDAPDGILGDVGRVESCFSPLGDSVSMCAR
jgi:hypothetical protein